MLRALRGQVQFDARTGELVRWQGGGWQPLPTRSPLARPTSVYGADGLVVVTAVAGGRPLLTVLADGALLARGPDDLLLRGSGEPGWVRIVLQSRHLRADE
ncbi:hypothetical protein [Micromonospora chersina]|uniref:hypothetical protein n=1 Tax=Micromonospora chersina TaxID=47854 RepID=UPI0033D0CA94